MSTEVISNQPAAGMAWIPSGTFAMGPADFYPEKPPMRQVAVGGFWMDAHLTTWLPIYCCKSDSR